MIEAMRLAAVCFAFVAADLWIAPGASANDCAAQCYAQENACRRATKDSPSCGADLTRCLQGCRKGK